MIAMTNTLRRRAPAGVHGQVTVLCLIVLAALLRSPRSLHGYSTSADLTLEQLIYAYESACSRRPGAIR